MREYRIKRSNEYLEHAGGLVPYRGHGVPKQKDLDGDGKLEWTEEGKRWRREQYRAQKESRAIPNSSSSSDSNNSGGSSVTPFDVITKNDLDNFDKAESKFEKGITDIGDTIDSIHEGKKYDAAREALLRRASTMSDDELRTITNRLNLESNYAKAVMGEGKRGKVTFGKVMGIVGGITAAAAGIGTVAVVGMTVAEKAKKLKKS